jgi:hypothetical protein
MSNGFLVALLAGFIVFSFAGCEPATLTELQDEILTPTCAAEGCHGSFLPERDLDLSEGRSYESLVNVASQESSYTLVVPGEPDQSLLYLVLENEFYGDGEDQPVTLGKMPPRLPGTAGLSNSDRASIRSWIADGAMDN